MATVTIGDDSPAGYALGELGAGAMYLDDWTLAGADLGASFTKIRVRTSGTFASGTRKIRAVIYKTDGTLMDWAEFVIPAGQADTLNEAALTGGAIAANGTYYLGVHVESNDGPSFGFTTSGVTGQTKTVTYGTAPPSPLGTTNPQTDLRPAVEAEVSVATPATSVDRFSRLKLGTGLAGTDLGGGTLELDNSAPLPAGGTAGQMLTKDTTTDYDTSWQTPSAAVPPTLELIQTITLGSSGQFNFLAIPQTYRQLLLIGNLRSAATGLAPGYDLVMMRINNNVLSAYSTQWLWGSGTTVAAGSATNAPWAPVAFCTDVSVGAFAPIRIELPTYSLAQFPTWVAESFTPGYSRASHGGVFAAASPVSSLQLLAERGANTFVAGSSASLYGIRG